MEKVRIRKLSYPITAYLIALHVLALSAFLAPFHWRYVPAAMAVYLFMGFGITVGFHRLLTHQSFKCPKWLEYFLVTGGAAAAQGSPLLWVANHRIHHGRSDLPGDIHSPRDGFWYSHIGWVYDENSTDPLAYKKYCRELADDRYYQFLLRHRLVPQLAVIVAIGLVLGWAAIPFVFGVTTVCVLHATLAVNSLCHINAFGSRMFYTKDDSRNFWFVGLVALGEGWHNNHHALPRSVRHGLARHQLDLSYLLIRGLSRIGLAWDLQFPSEDSRRMREVA